MANRATSMTSMLRSAKESAMQHSGGVIESMKVKAAEASTLLERTKAKAQSVAAAAAATAVPSPDPGRPPRTASAHKRFAALSGSPNLPSGARAGRKLTSASPSYGRGKSSGAKAGAGLGSDEASDDAKVQTICACGFSPVAARLALCRTGGSADEACNWLIAPDNDGEILAAEAAEIWAASEKDQAEMKATAVDLHGAGRLDGKEPSDKPSSEEASDFDGIWQGNRIIRGKTLTWETGDHTEFVLTSRSTLKMHYLGTTYHGELMPSGCLRWDDGEVWTRSQALDKQSKANLQSSNLAEEYLNVGFWSDNDPDDDGRGLGMGRPSRQKRRSLGMGKGRPVEPCGASRETPRQKRPLTGPFAASTADSELFPDAASATDSVAEGIQLTEDAAAAPEDDGRSTEAADSREAEAPEDDGESAEAAVSRETEAPEDAVPDNAEAALPEAVPSAVASGPGDESRSSGQSRSSGSMSLLKMTPSRVDGEEVRELNDGEHAEHEPYEGEDELVLRSASDAVIYSTPESDDEEDSGVQVPPVSDSWDWPLSRQEKKSRVEVLERNMHLMDKRTLIKELVELRVRWRQGAAKRTSGSSCRSMSTSCRSSMSPRRRHSTAAECFTPL